MLTYPEIKAIYTKHHRHGDGAVNDVELEFMQGLIVEHRPKVFVEIGVASGMSSGFIARFMSENGGQILHSIDVNERYYADETKPVGFLIPEIYSGTSVRVALHIKKSAFDLPEVLGEEKYDMAFIDANHAHPWPTIDTMLLLPFAKAGSLLLHHDLSLYKLQEPKKGIGPKYLFDQFGTDEKQIIQHSGENIGYVKAPSDDYRMLESKMTKSMMLPWTARLHPYFLNRFRPFLGKYWGPAALEAFEDAYSRHNDQAAPK